MSEIPLVSIVMPTYNQVEVFLREAIESAINQTYKNIEIIISDNHCDNGGAEIMAEYAAKDSRIRIVKPPVFLSLIENFVFAYTHVKGEFICPLSSDDILYPEIVEEQLRPFLTTPELSFSFSIPLFFSTDINAVKWKPDELNTGFYPAGKFLPVYINRRDCCSWGGILFKTVDYNKMGGFSKDVNFAADVDAIVKLMFTGNGVYCINKPLSAIRRWDREELIDRTPFLLEEVATIFANIDKRIAFDKNLVINKKSIAKAKRIIFNSEALPIAYFTIFKKRNTEVIERTAAVIKENYPKGLLAFIINNRRNIIGLAISIIYLGGLKIKKKLGVS